MPTVGREEVDKSSWLEHSIELARRGSDSALGLLLAHYREYLLKIAEEELPSALAAKFGASDVVQETCLQASREFGKFHGKTDGELRGWLRQSLLHNLIDAQRKFVNCQKRNVHREAPIESAADLCGPTLAPQGESPLELAIQSERAAAVVKALERLTETERKVVVLRNFEDRSFPEIALEMGETVAAVQRLWSRAVDRVAELLSVDDSSVPRRPS